MKVRASDSTTINPSDENSSRSKAETSLRTMIEGNPLVVVAAELTNACCKSNSSTSEAPKTIKGRSENSSVKTVCQALVSLRVAAYS